MRVWLSISSHKLAHAWRFYVVNFVSWLLQQIKISNTPELFSRRYKLAFQIHRLYLPAHLRVSLSKQTPSIPGRLHLWRKPIAHVKHIIDLLIWRILVSIASLLKTTLRDYKLPTAVTWLLVMNCPPPPTHTPGGWGWGCWWEGGWVVLGWVGVVDTCDGWWVVVVPPARVPFGTRLP